MKNRVDPFGDLHDVAARGLFTGNRGCLVDDGGQIVRHHRGNLWITCVLRYKQWRSPLAQPRHWTPLFFLDDAVALAAGHRPCGLCRRDDYESYRDAVTLGTGSANTLTAADLNARLAAERLTRGRGLERASDRLTWQAPIASLPDGTVILDGAGSPRLLIRNRMFAFTFGGWTDPQPQPSRDSVTVLTPSTSVIAVTHGFTPTIHPSVNEDDC